MSPSRAFAFLALLAGVGCQSGPPQQPGSSRAGEASSSPEATQFAPGLEGPREHLVEGVTFEDGAFASVTHTFLLTNTEPSAIVFESAGVTTSTVLYRSGSDFPLRVEPGETVELTVRSTIHEAQDSKRSRAWLVTDGGERLELVLELRAGPSPVSPG